MPTKTRSAKAIHRSPESVKKPVVPDARPRTIQEIDLERARLLSWQITAKRLFAEMVRDKGNAAAMNRHLYEAGNLIGLSQIVFDGRKRR